MGGMLISEQKGSFQHGGEEQRAKARSCPESERGSDYSVKDVPPMPLEDWNGLGTADMGSTTRATKVACISVTASSMEMPIPSLRISTPKILAAHIAPYSLAPLSVTSKGRIWSEYQGVASSLLEALLVMVI